MPLPREDLRLLLFILSIYIFVCIPLAQFYSQDNFLFYNLWRPLFFLASLTLLFLVNRIDFLIPGMFNPKPGNMVMGLGLGMLPIVAVVGLDAVIVKSGLAGNDLFAGADLRDPLDLSAGKFLLTGFFNPAIEQIFITGYVLHGLTRSRISLAAIVANGILFCLIQFHLSIGLLILGIVSAGLLRATGSLLPAIFFSIGCSIAKILILTSYPRITTALVFLI